MSDLASRNDTAANDMSGRIGNNTWCKCKCCAPIETSIGACCLEIPEIWMQRFSSTSCLQDCGSDPYFVQWYSNHENFVNDLISNQSWSMVNPNKIFFTSNFAISFSVKHFTYLIFFFIKDVFLRTHFFQKSIQLDSGNPLLLKSNILSLSSLKQPFTGAQESFKWWRTLRDTFSSNLKKYLGLVSNERKQQHGG